MSKNLRNSPKSPLSIFLKVFFCFSLLTVCKTIISIPNFDLSSTPLDPIETGFMMSGTVDNDYLGFAVGPAGDINGDGYADVLVGAYGKESSKGYVYVVYGGPSFSSSYANLDLTALDPSTTGFVINRLRAKRKFS